MLPINKIITDIVDVSELKQFKEKYLKTHDLFGLLVNNKDDYKDFINKKVSDVINELKEDGVEKHTVKLNILKGFETDKEKLQSADFFGKVDHYETTLNNLVTPGIHIIGQDTMTITIGNKFHVMFDDFNIYNDFSNLYLRNNATQNMVFGHKGYMTDIQDLNYLDGSSVKGSVIVQNGTNIEEIRLFSKSKVDDINITYSIVKNLRLDSRSGVNTIIVGKKGLIKTATILRNSRINNSFHTVDRGKVRYLKLDERARVNRDNINLGKCEITVGKFN